MSKKFMVAIDLNKNELQNSVLQNLAVAPSSPSVGQQYFDTVVNKAMTWSGTTWISGSGGTVTAVTGIGPIMSSGGNTPAISIPAATNASDGYATAAHIQAIEANSEKISNATHTGEVTGTTDLTITNKAVTLAKMADMSTNSLIGRNTASSGSPEVLPIATVKTMLGLGTAAYINTGSGSGNVPVLDTNGKLNSSTLPALAITDTFVVASQAAQIALSTADVGDVCIRTDLNKSFILQTAPYSNIANWKELLTPTDSVTSVAGRTGIITLSNTDISGLGTMSTQNAASVAITGGSISGIADLAIADGGTGAGTVAGAKANLGFMTRYAVDNTVAAAGAVITYTHNLGTLDVTVQVYEKSSGANVEFDICRTSVNTITITSNTALTAGTYRIVVIG